MGKKSKTIKKISAKDLAKLKTVSLKSIYNAVESGRLTPVDPAARPLLFDHDKAISDWENFRQAEHVPKSKRDRDIPDDVPEDFDEDSEVTKQNAGTHRKIASAKLEKFKAENERLKYFEQLGKLVDVDNVEKEAFQLARITRDAMLAIPDRISAQLCGITDPVTMHATLIKEINGALDQLVKQYGITGMPDAGASLQESLPTRADT